jgi:hypothetical protein
MLKKPRTWTDSLDKRPKRKKMEIAELHNKTVSRYIYIEVNPCGGGVEYLHRKPASRKRRRNGTKKARAIA